MAEVTKFFENPNVVPAATPLPPRRNLLKFWAKAPESTQKEVAKPKDVEFKKNEFTIETGTKNTEKVKFNEATQADFQMQLENSLTTLVNIYNDDPGSEIFASDRLSFLPKMLEDLCDKDDLGYKINPDTIKNRLQKDPRAWKEAMQLIEFDLSLTEMALAIEAQVNPNELNMFLFKKGVDNNSSRFAQKGSISLGIKQGKLNAFLQQRAGKLVGTALFGAAGSAGGAAVGQVLGVPGFTNLINMLPVGRLAAGAALNAYGPTAIGAAGGLAAGAAVGGAAIGMYAGLRSAMSRGFELDIKKNTEFLKVLKNPTDTRFSAEKAYLKKVIGINVDEYDVVGNKVVTNGKLHTSTDVSRIESQFIDKVATRFNFLTNGLGIPPNKVRAVPDNFVQMRTTLLGGAYPKNKDNYEPINTTWRKEEMDRAQEIIDKRRAAGTLVRTTADMFDVMFEARSDVMNRNLNKRLREKLVAKPDRKIIDTLTAKSKTYKEGGDIMKKKTEELRGVKTALENSKTPISADQASLDGYTAKRAALDKARAEAQSKYGVSSVAELQREIDNRSLVPDSQLEQLANELREAETNYENARKAIDKIDSFDRAHILLDTMTNPLTGVDARLRGALRPAVNIDRAFLASQGTTANEVLKRINLANERASTVPPITIPDTWGKQENGSADKRREMLQIMAEAQAESAPVIASPMAELAAWKSSGVPEQLMRNSTPEVLLQELIKRGIVTPTTYDLTNPTHLSTFNDVISQAKQRFDIRVEKLTGILQDEERQRKEYNGPAAAERETYKQQAEKLRDHKDTIAGKEAAVTRLRNSKEIGRKYAIDNTTGLKDITDNYKMIESWHHTMVSLSVGGYANELDLSRMPPPSIQDLLNGIHLANRLHSAYTGAGVSSIGWPPTADMDGENVRRLITAHAAANTLYEVPDSSNAEYNRLRGFSIDQLQIATLSPEALIDLANTAGAGLAKNARTIEEMKRAKVYEKMKSENHAKQITDDLNQFIRLSPAYTDADLKFLEVLPNDKDVLKDLADYQAKLTAAGLPTTGANLETEAAKYDTKQKETPDIPELTEDAEAIKKYRDAMKQLADKRREAHEKANGATKADEIDTYRVKRSAMKAEDLQTAKDAIQKAESDVQELSDDSKKAQEVINTMKDAPDQIEVIGLAAASAIDLSPSALILVSFDDLMARINQSYEEQVAGGAIHPTGWPKAENGMPEHQKLLRLAIAEARTDVDAGFSLTALANLNTLRGKISDYVIMNMTPQELIKQGAELSTPLTLTPDEARELIQMSRQVYDRRVASHKEILTKIDTENRQLDEDIADIKGTLAKDALVLDKTVQMVNDQGRVFKDARKLVAEVANKRVDLTVVPTTNAYITQEELDFIRSFTPPLPRGVLTFLNLMTNYQQEPDRGAVALKLLNTRDFSPEAIAYRASEGAKLGLTPPASNDPVTVFAELQRRIIDHSLTAEDMYEAMKAITDNCVAVAMAK